MALPSHIRLEIVTPDHPILDQLVDEVQVPGEEGYFGVLPGHTPMLAALQVGQLWYRVGQDRSYLSIAFGFAEVLPDHVTILAHVAERAEEIDVGRAEAARARAQRYLERPAAEVDFERARIALLKSLVRLQVASRMRLRV